jgi:hypothetical protein
MKLKIDTESKVVQVEQQCKLVELFDFVKKIFPDNEWKKYSIEAVPVIINWNNPIYVPYTYTVPAWQPQLDLPSTICETGTYCIQTN